MTERKKPVRRSRKTKPLLPHPGPMPMPGSDESRAALEERLNYYGWQLNAHDALYAPDSLYAREIMLSSIKKLLHTWTSLPEPGRIWLMYVLQRLDPKDIPTEHPGRPADHRVQGAKLDKLTRWWMKREISHPKEHALPRMHAAADALGLSFSDVKKLRYTEGFKRWLAVQKLSFSTKQGG